MDVLKRVVRAVVFGAVGAGVGGVGAWMFFAIWTSVFGGVPLKYAWQRVGEQPSTNLLGVSFVAAGVLLGLAIGVTRGARDRRDSS